MKTLASLLAILTLLQTQLEVNVQLRQRVVTVRDRTGQIARGLKAEDFVLEEDGAAQTIRHFTEDSETPVALGFLFDVSDSMALKINKETKETRLSAAVAASQLLIRSMKPGDEFLLMTASTTFSVREKLTKDPKKIEDRLVKLKASGFSNLMDTLERAMKELRKSTHRKRALVVFTDGEVAGERDHTRKLLENAEMLIYTFAINETTANLAPIGPARMSTLVTGELLSTTGGPPAAPKVFGDEVLKLLAGASGGRSEVFANASGRTVSRVQDFAKDIAAELRGQYTIGYYPNTSRSSIQPTVRIRTKSPEYQVRMQRNPIEIVE